MAKLPRMASPTAAPVALAAAEAASATPTTPVPPTITVPLEADCTTPPLPPHRTSVTLARSGRRISEALALTAAQVNLADGVVAIRSLKKRGRLMMREIPLPRPLLRRLADLAARRPDRLWPLSRNRAWQLVRALMRAAAIRPGPQFSPRGLRHGFGVHAIRSGVPVTLVQRWLGHASLATTALYTQVLGLEERAVAGRMWA